MVVFETDVDLKGVTARQVYDFLLTCTDADYQQWWKGMHLVYHTVKKFPDDVGNVVAVDEFVGKFRLKGQAIVTRLVPYKEMVWQLKKTVKLPAWLTIRFQDLKDGVKLIHIVTAGFQGTGKIIDPLIRLYLTKEFERQLTEHAHEEFPKLAEMLSKQRS